MGCCTTWPRDVLTSWSMGMTRRNLVGHRRVAKRRRAASDRTVLIGLCSGSDLFAIRRAVHPLADDGVLLGLIQCVAGLDKPGGGSGVHTPFRLVLEPSELGFGE